MHHRALPPPRGSSVLTESGVSLVSLPDSVSGTCRCERRGFKFSKSNAWSLDVGERERKIYYLFMHGQTAVADRLRVKVFASEPDSLYSYGSCFLSTSQSGASQTPLPCPSPIRAPMAMLDWMLMLSTHMPSQRESVVHRACAHTHYIQLVSLTTASTALAK